MDYHKYMEHFNENNHFMRYNGMKLVALKEGYAEMEMELNDNSLNIQGTLHGGAMYTLADTAAGAAAKSYGLVSITLNGSINFIKTTKTGKVKAIASTIHQGRTTGVYRVEVMDENKDMLAWCTFTMFSTGVVIEI
jgi:acyl-CoA thioesterase